MILNNRDTWEKAKKRAAAAKAAKAAKDAKAEKEAIAKMKKNPAYYDAKGRYGFDGMQGIPAKDAYLKGK